MEKQQSLLRQISPEDWENTPANVKRLVESLLASAALANENPLEFLNASPTETSGQITALQQQVQREQSLNQVFHAIRNSLDLNTIFATATAKTAQILALDCSVMQYLSEQGVWRQVAEFRHHQDPSTIGFEFADAGNPVTARLKQLQIVRVEDTASLDNINREVAQTFPGAWLLIPLVIEGTLWGSLTISTTQHPFIWSDDQVELAQSVANQLELAIEQANLYHQVQMELAERRRVETALRESEARFKNMAANVPGAILRYLLRPDGSDRVLYMSPGCYRLWEVEAQAVVEDATILWQMVHPEDLPAMVESVRESVRTLEPWIWAWQITTPSGQEKWLEATGKPDQQANGDVIWDTLILDISDRKQAEAALQESEQRFRKLFESVPKIAVQGYNCHRQVIYWNDASAQIYGYSKTEAMGQKIEDLIIPPQMRQQVVEDIQNWQTEGRAIPAAELSLKRQDGSPVTVYSSHVMLNNSDGEPEMYCVDIDLSDRKQAEEALRESEARYRLVADNMNDLVCLHDLDGRYLYVSPSCESLLGYRSDELLGQVPYTFFHPDDCDRVYREHLAALSGNPTPTTYRMCQKSGSYIWFEALTKPIVDATGQIIQLQTTSRNVSERMQAQARLEYDALHDALTGLPNRLLLMERLELALNRAERSKEYRFAVIFLDLDRFKIINDSLGHLAGDQLLTSVAEKLRSIVRGTDLTVRLGGDEFVILLEEVAGVYEAVRVTKRIFAQLQTPLIIEGREVYTTASVGIVLGNQNYTQASHLLRDADIAMYRAKTKGTRYEIFNPQMYTKALHRLHLDTDLRRAVERQEFLLHYQPIIALDTGSLVGFEALIRWQHPTEGLKFPGEFIAVAEETGLIVQIDAWALHTACHQLAAWQTAFPDSNLKVSVNLSAPDLRRSDLLQAVDRVLTQTRLNGRCLTLEITERMLIEDVEKTIDLLNQLKERGIHISIDDFGTGYSSLSYLHRLSVDSLKVDRAFVNQMQEGTRNYQIVATIAALSNQLELDAVAEGIETQQQLQQLQQLGYKFGQGYFFSKPLSPQAANALIASSQ